MRKLFRIIGIFSVFFIAVVLSIAASRSNDFSVSRSIVIAATPAKITPLIDDFHNWQSWSPWEHLDPNMQKTFAGASSGPGAMYAWKGNSKAGEGSMTVLSESPAQTKVSVGFIKPFPGTMISTFDLVPVPEGTRVTWTMSGKEPFVEKVVTVFYSMDKMVGGDFNKGLAAMKQIAEK